LREKVKHAIEVTKDNTKLFLTIAWNYGGRDEIVYAVQKMMTDGLMPEEVNEKMFDNYLFTAGTPDPDLIIRTSGELRLSNFLVWQSAYSEWVVSPVYWPDYSKEDLRQAILEFGKRDRRYGKVSSKESNG
jgi:undecaprenyl diphosphate synthase